MTSDPDFKVGIFFDIEKLSQKRHETEPFYYKTSIGSHRFSIAWWYFQWPLRTLTRVSRSRHLTFFEVECLENILGTKLLQHMNRKAYLTYGIEPCWWPWLTSKREARFVSNSRVSWLHCVNNSFSSTKLIVRLQILFFEKCIRLIKAGRMKVNKINEKKTLRETQTLRARWL